MAKRKPGTSKPEAEWYFGAEPFFFAFIAGRAVEVSEFDDSRQAELWVHVGLVNRRMACVGVDFRTFTHVDERDTHKGVKPLSGRVEFADLTSPIWRSIPVASLIDRAIGAKQDAYRRMLHSGRYPQQRDIHDRLSGTDVRKVVHRGPRSSLTDELLTIVAEAYGSDRRRPVQAVQAALEAAGYPGAGPENEVTIDQARKAVQAARRTEPPLIPPARRPSGGERTNTEEQE